MLEDLRARAARGRDGDAAVTRAVMSLVGQRFGRLVVIDIAGRVNGVLWNCLCDCGNRPVCRTGHLRAGNIVSCGCARLEAARDRAKQGRPRRTHGLSHTRLAFAYDNMMKRCYRPQSRSYGDYGARGIRVCDEWRADRAAFFSWALANGYAPDLQIERIDNDGNYEPGNCRWATAVEQANNTRKNRFLEFAGRRMTTAQWAREIGVAPQVLQHRLSRGWSIERVLTQSLRVR